MNIARTTLLLASTALLAACISQRPAPVVDRSGMPAARAPAIADKPGVPIREARDGVYTVQPGDTLHSIAMSFGVDAGQLIRWNDMPEGGALRLGQPLRVTPPTESPAVTVMPVTPGGTTEVRPLPAPGTADAPLPPATALPPPAATAPPAAVPPVAMAPDSSAAVPDPSAALAWIWPTAGSVIEGFDAPRNKGIDIGGIEGTPVQAAADGEVVHVGSALRGYGNLVIIRHAGDYVTAYGHNRKILVTQGQQVKRGQQIAELGRSDADRPKLHFELRHQGKPLDPVKYLPPR